MPEHDHLPDDEYPSVSGLKLYGDPLLAALKREHGEPRYDYPPQLIRYYKLNAPGGAIQSSPSRS
jgi:hypothetical protein